MKNKELQISGLLTTLLLTGVLFNIISVIKSAPALTEFVQQIILNGALLWLVLIISRQNQDDDDWAF